MIEGEQKKTVRRQQGTTLKTFFESKRPKKLSHAQIKKPRQLQEAKNTTEL